VVDTIEIVLSNSEDKACNVILCDRNFSSTLHMFSRTAVRDLSLSWA
jgi:hypothetical protein